MHWKQRRVWQHESPLASTLCKLDWHHARGLEVSSHFSLTIIVGTSHADICPSYATFWQYADSGPNPGDQDLFNGDLAGLQR